MPTTYSFPNALRAKKRFYASSEHTHASGAPLHWWNPDGRTNNPGLCPRCKEKLKGMMTSVVDGVDFCWLCSHNTDENPIQRRQSVEWAKARAREEGL